MGKQFKRFMTARMAPKRIWQAVLMAIFLMGIYLFLPTTEVALARQWLEAMLGRGR